ncbi:MAG TPA: GDP-L-fucose synthase [Bacteroidales bacterium]|nr:GDP-L-fucose synthase [Bacteroidales bacterium]
MQKTSKIYLAGHTGLVGSAIYRNLIKKGYQNIIGKTIDELDLKQQSQVEEFFLKEKPEYVIIAAAKVGGIIANNVYRAEFLYDNLMIQNNLIHSAYKTGVKKLLFLGSSCIYPKLAPQPIREQYLLTGLLEETNEPYAIAKIAGIKMCESYYRQYGCDFISVMPTNLYGPNDNYDLEKSHVLPALIRKMHLGKCLDENNWETLKQDLDKKPIEGISGKNTEEEIINILKKYGISKDNNITTITLWGTGQVFREFLHVDDMADACVYIMENISSEKLYKELHQTHINIGTGIDLTIKELADTIKNITGYKGEIFWDCSKPDGTPKKLLDVTILNKLGFNAKINLKDGIERVYEGYVEN